MHYVLWCDIHDGVVVNSPTLTNWNHKLCISKIKTVNQISEVRITVISISEVRIIVVSISEVGIIVVSISEVRIIVISISEVRIIVISISEVRITVILISEVRIIVISISEVRITVILISEVRIIVISINEGLTIAMNFLKQYMALFCLRKKTMLIIDQQVELLDHFGTLSIWYIIVAIIVLDIMLF